MPRFIKVATSSGGPDNVIGSPDKTVSGQGTLLYDVPGAWTPVQVCCNWDTPISGDIEFCFDPSKWDKLMVRIHGYSTETEYCSIGRACVLPVNNDLYQAIRGENSSDCLRQDFCNVGMSCFPFKVLRLFEGSSCCGFCSTISSFPVPDGPSSDGPWTPKSVNFTFEKGGYSRFCSSCNPRESRVFITTESTQIRNARGYTTLSSNYLGFYWPDDDTQDYSSDPSAFTKILLTNNQCCFIPGVACCGSEIFFTKGATFGLYGIPKYSDSVISDRPYNTQDEE